MKDQIKRTFRQLSPSLKTKQNNNFSFTLKKQQLKTIGSQSEDNDDNALWNLSTVKISNFYSPPKRKYDLVYYNTIIQENQHLKQEIKGLKQLLVNSHLISKSYEKIDGSFRHRKDDQEEQITKLRKILEKSYFSIKQMEQQILRLNQQILNSNKNLVLLQKKYKFLQFQKEQFQNKLNNINLVHKQEIQICNDRIWKLQMKIKELIEMIQQDQINWNRHTQELGKVKKVYCQPHFK